MSTQVAVTRPDYLAAVSAVDPLAAAASAGVGGRTFKTISIKQSRWRLTDEEGTEKVVESFSLPLVILAVNPAVSKTYYSKPYSPGETEAVAPDCYSDDGRAPGASSTHPQAQSCAACPMNVWGSAVNPTNGKARKACSDNKRMSVTIPGDPSRGIYGMRLSAMNMQSFAKFVREKVVGQGIRLDHIIVKASFDATAEFPLLVFEVLRNMTREEYEAYGAMRQEDEAKAPAGMGEKLVVHDAAPVAVAAPVVAQAAPAPVVVDAPVIDFSTALNGSPAPAEPPKKERKARSNVVVDPAPAPDALDALLAKALG
ncbi:MAG: hypothetical protein KGL63_13725 [Betaproteobacteria bacterium]|nr:hypothetical protein [Betaproteobacteria bacterium]